MAAERPPLDNETINSNKTFYCLKLYKEHHALNKIRSEAQSTSSSFIRARIFLWRLIQPKKFAWHFLYHEHSKRLLNLNHMVNEP